MQENNSGELDKVLDLDKLIHERVRLGIMSALVATETLTFQELKRLLNLTDGNLSVHLRILEKHKYILVEKTFVARKPQTSYKFTAEGKEAFKNYIAKLEKLVKEIRFD